MFSCAKIADNTKKAMLKFIFIFKVCKTSSAAFTFAPLASSSASIAVFPRAATTAADVAPF